MSRYTNNAIYTVVRDAVKNEYSFAYVTQTYSPSPIEFPTVFIREIGHFTPPKAATFSNAQDVSESSWEAQVFSNFSSGAKEEAYAIMSVVKTALRGLYFVEYFEAPIDQADKSIYCLVARFKRVIGSGESMPTI